VAKQKYNVKIIDGGIGTLDSVYKTIAKFETADEAVSFALDNGYKYHDGKWYKYPHVLEIRKSISINWKFWK
jgi:hypothetical protein